MQEIPMESLESITLSPTPALEAQVECLFSNYARQIHIRELAAPALQPELLCSFGDHFRAGQRVFSRGEAPPIEVYPGHPTAQLVESSGEHWTFGILFKPWAFALLESCNGLDLRRSPLAAKMHAVKNLATEYYGQPRIDDQHRNLQDLSQLLSSQLAFRAPGRVIGLILQELEQLPAPGKSVREVAGAAGLSHKSVISHFKKLMSITPLRFVHQRAVLQSLPDLRAGSVPIAEIALDRGFFDQSHFNRVFKSFMLVSPGLYRQMHLG